MSSRESENEVYLPHDLPGLGGTMKCPRQFALCLALV